MFGNNDSFLGLMINLGTVWGAYWMGKKEGEYVQKERIKYMSQQEEINQLKRKIEEMQRNPTF